jgi:hypothetical protein
MVDLLINSRRTDPSRPSYRSERADAEAAKPNERDCLPLLAVVSLPAAESNSNLLTIFVSPPYLRIYRLISLLLGDDNARAVNQRFSYFRS